MKKLLLSIAVVLSAMTASAQKTVSFDVPMVQKVAMTATTNGSASVVLNNNFSKVAKAQGDVVSYIDYGIDWAQDPDETQIDDCSSAEITLTGETEVYNGKTYNVGVVTLGSSDWKALVSDDKSEVVLPKGQTYDHPEYGAFTLLRIDVNEDDQMILDDQNDIVYTLDETGVLNTTGYGWYVEMLDGDYAGYCWSRKFYSIFLLPNGVENGNYAKGSWSTYTNPIYVQEDEDASTISVYNFYGTSKLDIIYEDGELFIPMGQNVAAVGSSSVDNDVYGYFFRILGCDVTSEGKIRVNEDKEYTNALFATVERDEDGEGYYVESTNNIVTDYSDEGYMGIFTNFDADGAGYYMGYLFGINFTLTDGAYKFAGDDTGIKDVTVSAKDNKFYNVLGQQVSAATKGLVIRNGRKYMVK